MNKVDILLLGSGGREHALLAKLAESPRAGRLYVAPGNGGMDVMAEKVEGLDAESPVAVAEWARNHSIGLVVIGPEAPLVAGVADAVRSAGIACFGPNGDAAQMEGSKKFAKQVMSRAGVPTAAYRSFTDEESCADYVRRVGAPIVVKADGLAAGKGVIVAKTLDEALAGVHECFSGAFGEAGATVVVEETLDGPECSLLALTDGKTVVPLATAQDHKRALDGDKGPNTGGMGVYSPVPEHLVSAEQLAAMVEVERKVVAELAEEGITYSGCLYGGFMLTSEGPKVLEFNARFGDPETQVVLPRMKGDLVELFLACDNGTPLRGHGLLGRRLGGLGGAHLRRLPRRVREGQGHHRHRARRGAPRRDRLPRRHRARRGRLARHRRRPRARRHRRGAHLRGGPRARLRRLRAHRLRGQDVPLRHRHARNQAVARRLARKGFRPARGRS